MILTDKEIRFRVIEQKLIEGFKEDNLQSTSYDITITKTISRFIDKFKKIDLSNRLDIETIYEEIDISNGYSLRPGETVIVQLNEYLNMPKDLSAHVRPRATFTRLGLILNLQHINPTYSGRLSLGLFNSSPFVIEMQPNIKIGQLVFEELVQIPTNEKLYKNKMDSKYQNEDNFTGSKVYKEIDKEIEQEYIKLHKTFSKLSKMNKDRFNFDFKLNNDNDKE